MIIADISVYMSRRDRAENEETGKNSRSKPKAGEKCGLVPGAHPKRQRPTQKGYRTCSVDTSLRGATKGSDVAISVVRDGHVGLTLSSP